MGTPCGVAGSCLLLGAYARLSRPRPSRFQVGRVFLVSPSSFSLSPPHSPTHRCHFFYLLKVMTLPCLRPPSCDSLQAALSVTSVPHIPSIILKCDSGHATPWGLPIASRIKSKPLAQCAMPRDPVTRPCSSDTEASVSSSAGCPLNPEALSAAALLPRVAPAATCHLPGLPRCHCILNPTRPPTHSLCDPGQVTQPFRAVCSSVGPGQE